MASRPIYIVFIGQFRGPLKITTKYYGIYMYDSILVVDGKRLSINVRQCIQVDKNVTVKVSL